MSVNVLIITVGEEDEIKVIDFDPMVRVEIGTVEIYIEKKKVAELINKLRKPDDDPYIII